MNIESFKIQTSMGQVTKWGDQLDFLTVREKKHLDEIGYTGKDPDTGERTTREKYLNSLSKGTFKVEMLKSDNGDFTEEFMVTRVTL